MKPSDFLHQLNKLDKLPKFSIVLSALFLLGFLGLNVLVYVENQKRFHLLDSMNRDSLLAQLTEAQVNLMQLDRLIDNSDKLSAEEVTAFSSHLDFLSEKMDNLQRGQLAVLAATNMAGQFSTIRERLGNIRKRTAQPESLKDPSTHDALNDDQATMSKAFLQIELQAQHLFQERVGSTLQALHNEEFFLFVFGLAFVVLGALLLIFLVQDLFRRSDMLDRAHEAERMKSSFFAMMSHEIRTPINGILGTLRLLQDTTLDGSQRQLTQTAYQSAEGLLVIINDVLDYSKIEAGKLQLEIVDFRLRPLVTGVMELMAPLAKAKDIRLSATIADDIPDGLHADSLRIRQIMLNFLSNAVKFTQAGFVHLEIKTERVEQGGMSLKHIRFEVTDSGMGIPPEVKARLFQEFSQADGSYARRFEGTGLGLAICRRLMEMMQGHIGVVSEVGKGSTFWFSFPLKPAQGAIEDEVVLAQEAKAQARTGRILLAEDNPTNQMIAVAFLKKGGHEVSVANNGREAVEAVKKQDFDMILMDISMPEMDGFHATAVIRGLGGRHASTPIIAMTAHAMRGDREACLQVGMDDYLTKPVSRDELLATVAKWLSKTDAPQARDSGGFIAAATGASPPLYKVAPQQAAEKSEAMPASPPAPAAPSEAEINEEQFQQIMSDLGRENVANFAALFLDDLKSTGQTMLDCYGRQEWPQVKTHAHSLKSSTKSFGLMQLSTLAQKIEKQCKEEGRAEDTLIALWLPCVASASAALQARLEKEGLPLENSA